MTVVITGVAIAFCLLDHAHYAAIRRKIRAADEALGGVADPEVPDPPPLDPRGHTAVFVVGLSRSGGGPAYLTFGTDPIEELTNIAKNIYREFPHNIFFTSKAHFRT